MILLTDLCKLLYFSFEHHIESFQVPRTHPETCTIDFDSYNLIQYVTDQLKEWKTDEETRRLTIIDLTRMSVSPDLKKGEYGIYFINFHISIPSQTDELKKFFDTLQTHNVLKYATGHLYMDRIEFTGQGATYHLQLKVRYSEDEPQIIPKFISALADYYDHITIKKYPVYLKG